jgi:hypothetical protein
VNLRRFRRADFPGVLPGRFNNIGRFRRFPCRLLRLWTKVLFAVVGTGSKIIVDYVIRRLYAFSASLKNRLKGLIFAETPLARSPDLTGAPSHLKQAAVESAL